MSREERLALRREARFEKHAIDIVPEEITEERQGVLISFKHKVMAGKRMVGRTTTRRQALKRAHQFCRDNRR